MNHELFDELKGAYVLGALPDEERRELEAYLAEYPERQAEVDELGTFACLLALSPREQNPPPELRRNIMSVVETEARPPARSGGPRFAGLGEFFSLQNLALGAAAVLIIALFSWNMLLQGEVQELHGRVAKLQDTPQSRMVALEGTGAAQQAHAEVMILEDHRAVLMAEDMPRVPEDSTYQIWVIEGDVPKPGGLFEPRREQVAAVVEEPLQEGDVIAVTIEPDGGSPEPTTEPMMTAKL
ncbi:MAG TPA: anti-sigma factor [Rubrobacteraceae bacterium]|jgi:anti-sigma-K factor RskA|nr:anti-sigma factor [Rubrobacteraceae bacterium]